MTMVDAGLPPPPGEALEGWTSCPVPWSAKVSPDGRWVAWVWAGLAHAGDLYVAPTDGSAPPRRMTATPEHSFPRAWTPDSRAVIVAQNTGGDEKDVLYRLAFDRPGELEPLTPLAPKHFTSGGQLHANGRWLVYAANLDPESGEPIEASWIFRHDLATGERKVLARRRRGEHYGPLLNRAGTHVLYHCHDRHPSGSQLWLVDIEGCQDREIVNLGDAAKVVGTWMPDSSRVLLMAASPTHERLGLYDTADGTLRWLLDDASRFVEGGIPSWDGGSVMIVEARDARVSAALLDLADGGEIPVRLGDANLLPVAGLPDGDWIGMRFHSTFPTEIVRFSPRRPGRMLNLSHARDRMRLAPSDFTPAEDFRWRSTDGLAIQGWLYRTRRPARGTIVWVHGGPTWHSEDEVNTFVQYLAAQGFNVLDPNYRGSTGFGVPFREAIKEDGWGGREQDDIRTGIEALMQAGIAEAGKVGVLGISYGGYSAWCALTRWPPETVAAAASICGMTDLAVDYFATELPHGRLYSEEMMGGDPDEVPDIYQERSPLNFIRDIRGRLLIVHGMRDPNVSPVNTKLASAALDAAGIDYELLTFADEGHGIWKRPNRRILFARVRDFFAEAFAGTRAAAAE